MTAPNQKIGLVKGIDSLIYFVRGQKVMLDSDLAEIYGVTVKRLNEQLRRNTGKFPADFAFQLTKSEWESLRSQFVTLKTGRGFHRKYPPHVFTEHGAIMLASVLNSPVAVDASVRVVRAFVRMRELLAAHKELAHKLNELENRLDGHDKALAQLFQTLRQLIEPPLPEDRRKIGFRETAPRYRVRTSKNTLN